MHRKNVSTMTIKSRTIISPISKVLTWIFRLLMMVDIISAFQCNFIPASKPVLQSIGSLSPNTMIALRRRSEFLNTSFSNKQLRSTASDDFSSAAVPTSDSVVVAASKTLRTASWFSWWSQVILTTVSTVTLLFARSVLSVTSPSQLSSGGSGGFFLAGSGIVLSSMSVFWTWGGARLSRRLTRRKDTSRIEAANLLRRTIKVGATVNLLGMLVTLVGAEAIIGLLAAKVLTSQGVVTPSSMAAASQLLQPLDILVVQANTNTLLSHFMSLTSLLYLTRWVSRLDPPSVEEKSK